VVVVVGAVVVVVVGAVGVGVDVTDGWDAAGPGCGATGPIAGAAAAVFGKAPESVSGETPAAGAPGVEVTAVAGGEVAVGGGAVVDDVVGDAPGWVEFSGETPAAQWSACANPYETNMLGRLSARSAAE
jgi:hypothetical protein